jgi:HEAT repeat protein
MPHNNISADSIIFRNNRTIGENSFMEKLSHLIGTILLIGLLASLGVTAGCSNKGDTSSTSPSTVTRSEINSLIQDLKNPDIGVRLNAVHTLGNTGDTRAVKPLIDTLENDTDYRVRCVAATALGKIGDKSAVEPLIESLKEDKAGDVRSYTAEALGMVGDSRAVEPLIESLTQDQYYGGSNAAKALGKMREKRAIGPLIDSFGNAWTEGGASQALVMIGEPAVDPLIEYLMKAEDFHSIAIATTTLGEIGDTRAVEPLIDVMRKEQHIPDIAKTLGKLRDARAVKPLIEQIPPMKTFDGVDLIEGDFRREVVKALGSFGPESKEAVPSLIGLVQNRAERAIVPKGSMLAGVVYTGGSGHFSGEQVYLEADMRLGAILEAIDALGTIKDDRALPVLEQLSKDEDPGIRVHAEAALNKIRQ